jgi:transposase InsO family protein
MDIGRLDNMPRRRYTPEEIIGKLRDELLKREIFYTLQEAQILVERWRQTYNRRRPHSALANRPLAPEAYLLPNWGSPLTAAAAFGLT